LLIKGTLDKTEKGLKIVSREISRLDFHGNNRPHKIEIMVKYPVTESNNLHRLRSVILSHNDGEYPLYLRVFCKGAETLIATDIRLSHDTATIRKIEEVAGKGAVILK